MKWVLILWAGPIVFLGSWYGLSYYDISFGIFMLTRQAHDLVFSIYGHILGISPETIPPLVARAIVVDSLLVFGILAFRKRAVLRAWAEKKVAGRGRGQSGAASLSSDDSLSSAP